MSTLIEQMMQYKPEENRGDNPVTIRDTGLFASGEQEDNLLLLDGDTFTGTDGAKYRLQGAHAPETSKVDPATEKAEFLGVGVPFTGKRVSEFRAAEAGGPETTDAVAAFMKRAAADGNAFDTVVKTGEKDAYGREVVRLTNKQGRDLTEELYRTGIYKPTPATDKSYVQLYESGSRARELGTFEGYQEVLNDFENDVEAGYRIDPLTGLPIYKGVAIDEAQYAAGKEIGGFAEASGVAFRDPNRTIDNMAENGFSTSAYTGWLGMVDGAYGFLELIGDTFEDDDPETTNWFQQQGKDRRESLSYVMHDLPEIRNFQWEEVDGFMGGVEFLANNMAASAPYMALIAGAGLVTGGVGLTGAAALGATALPTSVVYSGQIYNEMEGEKNAGAAIAGGIAAAALETIGAAALGLGGKALGIGKTSQVFTKEGVEALSREMVEMGLAASTDAAKTALMQATRKSAAEYFRAAGKAAIGQSQAFLNKTKLLNEVGKGALKGTIAEGLTEAGQETIQYVTAAQWSDRQFNQWELEDRIRDALIAGASLGGGLGGAGGVTNHASQIALRTEFSEANMKHLNEIESLQRQLVESGTHIPSVEENIETVQKAVNSDAKYSDEALAQEDKEKNRRGKKRKSRKGSAAERAAEYQKGKGFIKGLLEQGSVPAAIAYTISETGKLVASASDTAFNSSDLANENYGEWVRLLRSLVGQGRGVINPGRSFEATHDFIYSTLAQQIYIPEVMKRFGMAEVGKSADREAISKMLYEFGRGGYFDRWKRGESLRDAPAEIQKHADALGQTATNLQKMGDNIHRTQDEADRADGGEGVAYIDGWWWKHRDFDPRKVQKNKAAWFDFMRKNAPDLSEGELKDFYDRITGGEASTLDDYFSHVRGIEFTPGHHKQRSVGLSEKEGADMFMRDDVFDTMDMSAKSSARFATNRKYFGAGGKNLDYIFDQMEAAGMPTEKVNEMAWYTKAIIDSQSGNFNRIQNYKWAELQKFATTWSIFAGLPLAAFSSIPESAMIAIGLREGEVSKAASQAGMQIAKAFNEILGIQFKKSVENGEYIPVDEAGNPEGISPEQALLNKAGLLWSPQAVVQRLGVGETNISYSWYQDTFFKAFGITSVTQGQRRAAAAIFTDFVASRLAELSNAGDLSSGLTNSQQRSYVQLSELGMNVEQMVELWRDFGNDTKVLDYTGAKRDIPADVMALIDDNMQTGMYNFVNLRVQNPGAANRPLFFQDPHWQMLTQFNGFISTFTANIVPKLWNDYIRRGTPQMKYETFKLMLVMMALGGASQYMKDFIKYGRSTPYLENPELFQRAIYSSGILGQYERIVDTAIPLYDRTGSHRSMFDTIIDMAVGEAGPTVRNIGTLAEAAGHGIEGEGEKAVEDVLRVSPVVAPLRAVDKGIAKFASGENDFLEIWSSGYGHYGDL